MRTGARSTDTPERRLVELLASQPVPRPFTPDDLAGQPQHVRRYFSAAIEPGTPAAAGARLEMRGRIKLGRWLPFRARQLLAPGHGSVWAARVAGVISGSDRYVDGRGGMDWKLLGLAQLVHAEGDDVSRSAAERAGGESMWAPTALLPGPGVTWTVIDDEHVCVQFSVDRHPVRVEHRLDQDGRIISSQFERWGDPDGSGAWGLHPFGAVVTKYGTFAGVSMPVAGRAGWHAGTDRWDAGQFFQYEITAYELVGSPPLSLPSHSSHGGHTEVPRVGPVPGARLQADDRSGGGGPNTDAAVAEGGSSCSW
ncbi:MAG TPA: DUF6544 family protein [Cryptosporangiaceae bacterium]|nr:DUF6544 family protein [Cryptosporangiaceae bacterium]